MGGRPAAFLDRDGTIIADRDYPGDPDAVAVLPGAAAAISRLNAANVPVLVVTNQSGIGRGLISEEDFHAVQRRMEVLLGESDARIDGVYHCPHAPDRDPPCDCRKPSPGLYLRASDDHGIDLARSYYVGDRVRDVLPGIQFGGTVFLIRGTEPPDAGIPADVTVVSSLREAVDRIL